MTLTQSSAALIRSRAVRRAIAFIIGVGPPVIAGLALNQSGGVLLGVVSALTFCFADDEGPLSRRFTALFRAAAGVALGGAIGKLLGGYGWVFWLLFLTNAFAAAWLNRAGKTAHIGARLSVMALTIAAGTPEISSVDVLFLAGTLAVVSLQRLADHAIFGPLPASTLPPRPMQLESDALWLRFSLTYTAVAGIGLWLALRLDPQHAIWVVITTLVVMQPDDRSNYRRILERILGTVAGVVAAFAVTRVVDSEFALAVALVLTAAMLPHHIPLRYWLHTAAIALLVMLAYDLASQAAGARPGLGFGLFRERLIDVFIGCALAFVGTEIGFRWGGSAGRERQSSP